MDENDLFIRVKHRSGSTVPQPCKQNAGGLRSPKEVPKDEGALYPRCNRADVHTGGVEETPDFAPSAAAPAMATTAPPHIRAPKTQPFEFLDPDYLP